MTQEVTTLLRENNIYFVTVPNNTTHLSQPLDLTVNGFCKSFMKRKIAEWFAQQFDHQLTLGKKVEEIEIKFNLTEMRLIHTKWITEFYNHMSSEDGSKVIINGFKGSGIFNAITDGSSALPAIDPFQDIAPMLTTDDVVSQVVYPIEENFVNLCVASDEDGDSDWGGENEDFERNAFEFFVNRE